MNSTDFVIQCWGLTPINFEFPQLCGSKREDILSVCNTKSPSKAKNLELLSLSFFFFKLSGNVRSNQFQHPFLYQLTYPEAQVIKTYAGFFKWKGCLLKEYRLGHRIIMRAEDTS